VSGQFRYSLTSPVADPLGTISAFNNKFLLAEKGREVSNGGVKQH